MFAWLHRFLVRLTCQCITTEWREDENGELRCLVCGTRVISEDREQL